MKKKIYLLPAVAGVQLASADESVFWNNRLNKIINRFKNMSDGDLKIFVRILLMKVI